MYTTNPSTGSNWKSTSRSQTGYNGFYNQPSVATDTNNWTPNHQHSRSWDTNHSTSNGVGNYGYSSTNSRGGTQLPAVSSNSYQHFGTLRGSADGQPASYMAVKSGNEHFSWSTNQSPKEKPSEFQDISPRPFESAFKSAIEKMRHTSASRLEMIGNQSNDQSMDYRSVRRHQLDPRMTSSQTNSYVPTDTMSDGGWELGSDNSSWLNTTLQNDFKSPESTQTLQSVGTRTRHTSDQQHSYTNGTNNDFMVYSTKASAPVFATQKQSFQTQETPFRPGSFSGNDHQFERTRKSASDMALDSYSSYWGGQQNGSNNNAWSKPSSSAHNWSSQTDVNQSNGGIRSSRMVTIRRSASATRSPTMEVYNQNSVDNTGEAEAELVLPSVKDIIRQVEQLTSLQDSMPISKRPPVTSNRSPRADVPPPRYGRTSSLTSSSPTYGGIHNQSLISPKSWTTSQSSPNSNSWQNTTPKKYGNSTPDIISPRIRDNSPFKKSEQLSNFPLDYQKLRDSFIEQRREIQRLRKELADKDREICQLRKDVLIYEPWRRES